jgi:hypothetical protein
MEPGGDIDSIAPIIIELMRNQSIAAPQIAFSMAFIVTCAGRTAPIAGYVTMPDIVPLSFRGSGGRRPLRGLRGIPAPILFKWQYVFNAHRVN